MISETHLIIPFCNRKLPFLLEHRERYLEQKQTEKIETEVKRDVDRIRISKVYGCCPGVAFWGVIRALQSNININWWRSV